MKMTVPFARPFVPEESKERVAKVLESSYLGCGEVVEEFEEALKKDIGCKHVVCVNSGTSAIFLASLVKFESIEKIASPSLTMVATSMAVEMTGNHPRYYDADRDTYLPEKIPRQGVVVWYGGSAKYLPKGRIVEDCAHAMWSWYAGTTTRVGNSNNICAFSTQAAKILHTGDGGFVTTNDDSEAKELRQLRWFGMERDVDRKRFLISTVKRIGYKMEMNNVAAAIGLGQIPYKPQILNRLSSINIEYITELSDSYKFRKVLPGSNQYICSVEVENNRDFITFMKKKGVQCGVLYKPNHHHAPLPDAYCPNADDIFSHTVALPCYYTLTDLEQQYVIKCMREYA